MSKPINLNRVRKARARQQAAEDADQNAARFGRSKSEKQRVAMADQVARRVLDGAKREE